MLKTMFLPFLFVFMGFSSRAQQDPQLTARIDSMLQITQSNDLEKLFDYTYPRVFTIVKREDLMETMKGFYNTDEYSSTIDSVELIKVYPAFTIKDGQYAKLRHKMLMRMKFKEALDDEQTESLIATMEEAFGKGKVRFDKPANSVVISILSQMVAIKDEYSKDWSFMNYGENDPNMSRLLSNEVIEKLKEYK